MKKVSPAVPSQIDANKTSGTKLDPNKTNGVSPPAFCDLLAASLLTHSPRTIPALEPTSLTSHAARLLDVSVRQERKVAA
jgi:hypothetical protein